MLDDDLAVAPHGAGKVALEPAPRGRRVRTLAVVGAGALRLDGRDARLDQRQRAALGRHHAQRRAQRVSRGERRVVLEQCVDRGERVDEVGSGQLERMLVLLEGAALVAR